MFDPGTESLAFPAAVFEDKGCGIATGGVTNIAHNSSGRKVRGTAYGYLRAVDDVVVPFGAVVKLWSHRTVEAPQGSNGVKLVRTFKHTMTSASSNIA